MNCGVGVGEQRREQELELSTGYVVGFCYPPRDEREVMSERDVGLY